MFTVTVIPAPGPATVDAHGAVPPVTSQNAVLIVNEDITITGQPTSQTLCIGSTATFTVTATGNIASYQWRKGGIPLSDGGSISGAATATLTITGITAGDAGTYDVVISSPSGTCPQTISNPAVIPVIVKVAVAAPKILPPSESGIPPFLH